MRVLLVVLMLGVSATLCPAHAAEAWPSRAIHLIVPFPPGSSPDLIARLLNDKLSQALGQPVVIENKPGAGGNIGTGLVAKAAPDGYTIGLSIPGPLAVNTVLYKKMEYDPFKELAPITLAALSPNVLIVDPKLGVNTIKEFVDYVKARPGKLNYGSPGNGTHHHLCMELLKLQAGIDIVHIPYKGSAGAENDLVAGTIPAMFLPIHVALPKLKAGQIKLLGSTLRERHPLFPDIPSLNEQGITGYDVDLWLGVWGPANMPADLVLKINTDLRAIVATPEMRDQLASQGLIPNTNTPEQFAKMVRDDHARWAKVVRDAGIKAD